MTEILIAALAALILMSVFISPLARDPQSFYRGWAEGGRPPGVLTLTLSQVTTWIFARSLLTAAILGFISASPAASPTRPITCRS